MDNPQLTYFRMHKEVAASNEMRPFKKSGTFFVNLYQSISEHRGSMTLQPGAYSVTVSSDIDLLVIEPISQLKDALAVYNEFDHFFSRETWEKYLRYRYIGQSERGK